jgi:DNA-binding MarR family transcriptional regulator
VDRRAVFLRLTAQGQQVYRDGWPLLVAQARQIEEAIEPEDREAFNRTLLKLTEKAKQL